MQSSDDQREYVPPDAIDLATLPILSLGSLGDNVRLVQHYLNLWGFDHTPLLVHGRFNAQTAQALAAFQTRFQLLADGVTWPNTWQCLIPPGATSADRAARVRGTLFTRFRIHRH